MSERGTVVLSGPTEVSYGRFAALKGALKMEKVGLKSRGGALRPRLAKEFGLKPRDSYDAYIAYCESQMAILLAERRAQVTTTGK